MIKGLLIFIVAAALWLALLWFAIAPNFSSWSNLGLLAVHVVPPLAVWLGWWLLRRRALKKQATEAEAREQQAQAEREAALTEARTKHLEELRQRHFNCDCRVVAIADLAVQSEEPVVPEEVPTVLVEAKVEAEAPAEPDDALALLQPALESVLRNLYTTGGAAAVFPIYVLPPAEASGEEVIRRVRAAHAMLIEELALPVELAHGQPDVLFLPAGDSAANSVIALFETTPDLPGAVVLAFDSPLSRTRPGDDSSDDAPDPERASLARQVGEPSAGVFALLVTHSALPSMLNAIAGSPEATGEHDSLTPYWDKAMQPGGNLALLMRVAPPLRTELAELPVLAHIHRAAFTQTEGKHGRVLELTRALQSLLERAQVNAGLVEQRFLFEGAPADPSEDTPVADEPKCGWLVHNAGGVDFAGTRLAALGTALLYFDIDLNPIDMATNVVTRIGDLGRAGPIGMLALTVAQAAAHKLPALCSEFYGQDGIALSFAVPAKQG
jgi:hypothetical protein